MNLISIYNLYEGLSAAVIRKDYESMKGGCGRYPRILGIHMAYMYTDEPKKIKNA